MRVSAAILLAFHFRWCVAEAQCAHSPGSCGKQQSSLMQLRALGVRKAQAHTQHDSISSAGSRLAAFQKFADEMIDRDVAGRLEISQDVLDAVKIIHDFIDGLYPILNGSHTEDLTTVNACKKISTDCQATYPIVLPEGSGDAVTSAGESHKTCRDDRETFCSQETGACGIYDRYRNPQALTSIFQIVRTQISQHGSCTLTRAAKPGKWIWQRWKDASMK
jgi:hypothetical protein